MEIVAPPKNAYYAGEDEEGKYIQIDTPPSQRFVRKITGTSFGALIGINPWKSPFQAMCDLLGLADKDISQKPAIIAGRVLEDVIIEHCRHMGIKSASELFAPREGPHDEWPSDFEDEDFAGHLDGMSDDRETVIEVKTTTRPEDWVNGPPEHYLAQASLYAYFMACPKIKFLVGVLTPEEVKDPMTWNPKGHVYAIDAKPPANMWSLVGRSRVMRKVLTNDETFRLRPDANNPKDMELWEYLYVRQMDGGEIYDMAVELERLEAEYNEKYEAIAPLEAKVQDLRNKLKVAMQGSDKNKVHTYVLSTQERTSIDKEKMIQDGLDPMNYSVTKTTYVLKRVKEEPSIQERMIAIRNELMAQLFKEYSNIGKEEREWNFTSGSTARQSTSERPMFPWRWESERSRLETRSMTTRNTSTCWKWRT